MKISEIMTKRVGSCQPSDSLNEAAQIMWECDCGCVPVTDQNRKVVGIITDRDICMAAYTKGRTLTDIRIEEAMCPDPQCCSLKDTIEAAEELMRLHQIRRLPVVDNAGCLVGVLSLNDLALEYEREKSRGKKEVNADQVSSTLSAICAHTHQSA